MKYEVKMEDVVVKSNYLIDIEWVKELVEWSLFLWIK